MVDKPPHPTIEAPGLAWYWQKTSWTPRWRAPQGSGYRPPSVNLRQYIDRPDELVAKCTFNQNMFLAWKELQSGERNSPTPKTIGELLRRYQSDPDSPYWGLRPASRHPYDHYIDKLSAHIGAKRLDKITGLDLKRWHDVWSRNGERLAASKMARAVLDAAISYGIMCRNTECLELRESLKAASRKLPNPKRRESVITADQVVALRAAAHADGRASHALVYALVFETTLRLWDVIGQWWPIDALLISDVTNHYNSMKEAKKWFGLRWENLDEDLVLRYVPSKTSAKTGLAVTFPLTKAPMVVEELANWPVEKRTGPVILCNGTGLPFSGNYFGEGWRRDRKAVGLPSTVWARDLRASGITEAMSGEGRIEDAAKVAGHASTKTTAAVYDRANLEAAGRFADARAKRRDVGT